MTDHWTATRALDEIGTEEGWTDGDAVCLLLDFIELEGLDEKFSAFLEARRTKREPKR